jgi:hypothetical protein
MKFNKFLKTATPEDVASYELSFQRACDRIRREMNENEFMDCPDLEVEREIIIEGMAGLRLQLATSARNIRSQAIIYKDGLQQMANLAIKNAEGMEYWRKLALAYEAKLKTK